MEHHGWIKNTNNRIFTDLLVKNSLISKEEWEEHQDELVLPHEFKSYFGVVNCSKLKSNNRGGVFILKDLNVFIGDNWNNSGYACALKELRSFEDGPIKGSYVINGVIYGADFLSRIGVTRSSIVSINKGASYYPGEFSGLIDERFLMVIRHHDDMGALTFIEIEEGDLKTEDDLSLELAVSHEYDRTLYTASLKEEYLQALEYNCSISRGYDIWREKEPEHGPFTRQIKSWPRSSISITLGGKQMSVTIKFTITDEQYTEIKSRSILSGLSIQDQIRKDLFNQTNSFTPRDAIRRALEKYSSEETFSIEDLFEEEKSLPNGLAGQFGRRFSDLVKTEFSDRIKHTGHYNTKKHAVYIIIWSSHEKLVKLFFYSCNN